MLIDLQLLSVTSNLKIHPDKYITFSSNDVVNISMLVDLTDLTNEYFRQFIVGVYDDGNKLLYYPTVTSKYWTLTVSIARGQQTDTGLYNIVLFTTYSQEFISNCLSYYNFIRSSPFLLSRIIRDQIYVHLQYYGERNNN